jgi:hypothetical protein
MDLCSVISQGFIPQAINLIHSYKINSYDQTVYLYYFNIENKDLGIFEKIFPNQVVLKEVPKICPHALEPRVFFYKTYTINDCLINNSKSMIYSDSTNCFVRPHDIETDLRDESLFMIYNHPALANKYWTTKKCFEKMGLLGSGSENIPQYWAGLQAYKRTKDNISFVEQMLNYMKDPDIALPDTTVKDPDGPHSKCREHRQDQSVLSLLIHKHNRHQLFEIHRNDRYGDWQTTMSFNPSQRPNFDKMVLSPRESKFGRFRFFNG